MHVVVVVAHPDDETLRFGGTIAKYVKRGHKATIVILTRGGLGHATMPVEQLREVRVQESSKAAEILGAELIVMEDFEDRWIPADPGAVARTLIDPLRALRPDVILCNDPTRMPIRDQSKTARGVIEAAGLIYFPLVQTEHPPAPTPDMYYLPENGQKPDLFIDISDVMDTRIAAMRCYQSQIQTAWDLYWEHPPLACKPDASEAEELWIQQELKTELLWGKQSGTEYAEAYVAYHSPLYEARSAFPTREELER